VKRILIFVLMLVAAWYGWKHYKGFGSGPTNEAVIENSSGRAIERVRLTAGDQTYVREVIEDGAKSVIPFQVSKDGSFHLHWQWRGKEGEPEWSGGAVAAGPMVSRHHFQVMPDGGVVWSTEKIEAPAKP